MCGTRNAPEERIECRLYYGGRSCMLITGSQAEYIEKEIGFERKAACRVSVNYESLAVIFEAAGQKLTSRINGPVDAIAHYGYGGSNSAYLFTGITVRYE